MKVVEYGRGKGEVIVLLHGGGLSWWNFREAAQLLSSRFHVVLPVLDGHAGSDAPFVSIEANAARVAEYIDAHFSGRVALVGGLSLGAQVVVELLAQRSGICRCALIESAQVIPSVLLGKLIPAAVGCSWGLVRYRWFARAQFASLKMKKELFDDYYRDSCAIQKSDMIAFMRANAVFSARSSIAGCGAKVLVAAGGSETAGVRKSAKRLHALIPGSRLVMLPGFAHGELSINHAKQYADIICELVGEE